MMKWVCQVCGYVHEGAEPPRECPTCKAPASKFTQVQGGGGQPFAAEHVVGVAAKVEEDIKNDLRAHFNGECCEVGMYLAMARVAEREGYPEIAEAYTRYAFEEAEHAARFGEMLGEVITASTKKNLELRIEAEFGACAGKTDIAKRAKERNYDAIHDSVHEMARDEARHCAGFRGLHKRYFG
ncbi:MAG: NADH peroxidase [Treponema sp.]|jgi:rubrerythrin|nr:NADH peroxidase [Treponema sp.]